MTNPILRKLWRWVWQDWLLDDDEVVKVLSWRTAMVKGKKGRGVRWVQCCWWIFK